MNEVGVMTGSPDAEALDTTRRKFLTLATGGIAAIGAAFTAVPFVESWFPSERARALGAPVEVDLSNMEMGQLITAMWRQQVIYIVRRPQDLVAALPKNDGELKDPYSKDSAQPGYAQNQMRSRTGEFFVSIGYCTHLGCLPKALFDPGDPAVGASWPGGFLCPCHGSRYDMAGRVFDGSPAPLNLAIPPYSYRSPTTLVIGSDSGSTQEQS